MEKSTDRDVKIERRKSIRFVKKDVQYWLISVMVSFFTISLSAGFFIFYIWSHRKIGKTFYRAHYTINYVSDMLLPVIIICGLICFTFCVVFALIFQQRIAGPLYRIEEDLKKVAQGDFSVKVRIRATDKFHSLESVVNEVIERTKEELGGIRSSILKIDTLLDKSRYEEAKLEIEHLKERLEKLKLS